MKIFSRRTCSQPRARSLSAAALLLIALVLSGAAPLKRARLDYRRAEGGKSCPDTATLRAQVAGRLGYDPFDDTASETVDVEISGQGPKLVGRVAIREATGVVRGAREIVSEASDCRELSEALYLSIALALDPLSAVGPRQPEPQAPVPSAPIPQPSRSDPVQPAPVLVEMVDGVGGLELGLFALADAGTLPEIVSGGAAVSARARWTTFSLELALGGLAPRRMDISKGGALTAFALSATLAPCLHYREHFGCLVLGGGGLSGRGLELENATRAWGPLLTAGLRGGIEWPLTTSLDLQLSAEFRVNPLPVSFEVMGMVPIGVWKTSIFSGGVRVGVTWGSETETSRQDNSQVAGRSQAEGDDG